MEGTPLGSSVDKFGGRISTGSAAKSELEESGWTQYFEDFSAEQRKINGGFSEDDSFGSPSLISDAASPSYKEVEACGGRGNSSSLLQFPKRVNIVKKNKNKKYSCVDLEDTASSPVNSPKGKECGQCDILEQQMDEGSSKNNNIDVKFGSIELKKRGLCLIPFSMFVNSLD